MSAIYTSQPAPASGRTQTQPLAVGVTLLLLGALIVLPSGVMTPDEPTESSTKLDLALRTAAAAGADQAHRVIVSAVSGRAQDAVLAVTSHGGQAVDRFDAIGAVTTVVRADRLAALASDARVRNLSSDGVVVSAQVGALAAGGNGNGSRSTDGTLSTTDPAPADDGSLADPAPAETLATNHLLHTLGLDNEPWDGSGVKVAVLDSGLSASSVVPFWFQWDFREGRDPSRRDQVEPEDPYGHGTHVAGLIANNGWQSGGLYTGVAPGLELLYSLRVLDEHGVGTTSDVIRAIEFVLANQANLEVDVLNLSLGHPILEPAEQDPLVQAVEAATRAGIVVVVSAGNYGYDRATGEIGYAGITSPGNAPSALTVGALDTFLTDGRGDDKVARYSSRGPTWYDGYAKPDLVAPGSSLTSTSAYTSAILQDNPQLKVETAHVGGTAHLKLSGTSMAAAVTTGVVATMIHAQRKTFGKRATLTPNVVKAILQYTALDLGHDVLTQGAGGLNADGAVALAATIDTRTSVGQWWLTQGVTETSRIDGTTHTWGQRLVWGDRLIWGNHEVYTNEKAWDLQTVWGDRLVWGNRIIWGNADDSVVWGDRLIWGSRLVWGNDAIGFDDGTGIVYGDRIIWGNVTADRLIWGNLDNGTAGTMGVE